ncbi:hypothetical protein BgAZ_100640 [Babesia gibsoni]|uniref:Uncharacterized protein n=1 Tax=Babesia gibsoni TaxID=33632 RepID=A0AAD8PEZ2_BABGI|nr:hypothetical protein BgAZ_100640 [Babesia gibsoni]
MLLKKEKVPGDSQLHGSITNCNNNTAKFKFLLAQIASTWVVTLALASAHMFLCLCMIPAKCEFDIAHFNGLCAGVLLVFGCVQSLAVVLVRPLRVIHALLHYNVNAVKQESDFLSIAITLGWYTYKRQGVQITTGNIFAGTAMLVMPLYGFYVSLSSLSCKEHSQSHYLATIVISCIDSYVSCLIFWALIRGRDINALPAFRMLGCNTVKLNAVTQKSD